MDCPPELVPHSILVESYKAVEIIQADRVALDKIEVDVVDTLLDLLESAVEVSSGICVVSQELTVADDKGLLGRTLINLVLALLPSEKLV